MTADSAPKYRIVEAAERLGVTASVLRAWERRYGVPRPSRSTGGYRLYSEADLHWLSRMKELLESGLSAAEAAQFVRTERAPKKGRAGPAELERVRAAILGSAITFDATALELALRATSELLGASEAVRAVYEPVLHEVGARWADGRIDVAHEHWLAQRLRAQLAAMVIAAQPAAPRGTAVIACFAEETHDVACYALAVHLTVHGYRCVVLGARTPPSSLDVAVRELKPDLVCLSISMPPAASDRRQVHAYVSACHGRRLWLGGAGAAALADLAGPKVRVVAPRWEALSEALDELTRSRRPRR